MYYVSYSIRIQYGTHIRILDSIRQSTGIYVYDTSITCIQYKFNAIYIAYI